MQKKLSLIPVVYRHTLRNQYHKSNKLCFKYLLCIKFPKNSKCRPEPVYDETKDSRKHLKLDQKDGHRNEREENKLKNDFE